MKSFLVFLSGFICGVIFLIMFACILVNINSSTTDTDADNGITIGHPLSRPLDHSDTDNGITMLEHDGDCVSSNSFEVIEVLENGNALAVEKVPFYSDDVFSNGITVLFLADENKSFYDEQKIKVPKGECAVQIGIYKYYDITNKTVPIVTIK